jgi:putative AbiEii toxin of type IV toxin-antitoxin system
MPTRKTSTSVYFTSLEIENVRCFGDTQRLDLTDEDGWPARWTLILGDNGVGKTTLLQCLAWMRVVPVGDDPALLAEENQILEHLLRAGPLTKLAINARLAIGAALSLTDEKVKGTPGQSKTGVQLFFDSKRRLSEDRAPKIETSRGEFHDPLVVSYGANRQRGVQNLAKGELDDPVAAYRLAELTELYDIEEILSSLDYASKKKGPASSEHAHLGRLREVLAKILPGEVNPTAIEILPPDVLDSGEPSGVCLKSFSGLVPMSALSLGYQTTLAWTADLAWRLLKRYSESPNPLAEPAVVLIDEIDLHLHPLWQLRIIDDLSTNFPGTQFVATAHSPLMVQVAETANLVLLRKLETDVEIVNEPEVVRSWRVDQILTSELFAIPRARDAQTERLFERRDELVDKPSRSAAEEAELKELREKISELPTARDPDDQKAMDFIREAAALLKKHKVVGR